MEYLLDSHIILWAINEDPKLPATVSEIIKNPNNKIYYSPVSIWELSIKHLKHPDKISLSGKDFVSYCEKAGFTPLNLEMEHIYTLDSLSRRNDAPPHNDPFDKMLIAQAKFEEIFFITHDALLPYYDEPYIAFM